MDLSYPNENPAPVWPLKGDSPLGKMGLPQFNQIIAWTGAN